MTTKIKLQKNDVLTKTYHKVAPGDKCIELARQYINPGMDYEEMTEVMADVIDGFIDVENRDKLRRCNCCGYMFIDITKNNSALICSDECKRIKDDVVKIYNRKVVKINAGTARKSFKDGRYYGGEYSFWRREKDMFEYDRKHKVYAQGDNLEEVVAAAVRRVQVGGKKRNTRADDLSKVNWDVSEYTPSMEFYGDTKPVAGGVKVIKRSRADIEADLLERYGEKHLAKMRQRALNHACEKKRI